MNRKLLLLLIALAMPAAATAGSVSGHYLVWVNLAASADIDKRLVESLPNLDTQCWDADSLLYIRSRPKGMTNSLVRTALIERDKRSIDTLRKLLQQPFGEATEGFDGIIAYEGGDGVSKARLVSLTAGRRRVMSHELIAADGPRSLPTAFCNAMPDVVRKP